MPNELAAIGENGATSGAGVLATFGYDDLGRRTSLTRGNGAVTSYGYDAVSRLTSQGEDLAGTSHDQSSTFTFNPAGQIASVTEATPDQVRGGLAAMRSPGSARRENIGSLKQVRSCSIDLRLARLPDSQDLPTGADQVTDLPPTPSTLQHFLAKLERYAPLSNQEREAILALPHAVRSLPAGAYLIRDGERGPNCNVLLSGFACRHKVVGDGARQILSLHMKGDGIDFQNALVGVADHNIQTLTRVDVATVPAAAVRALIESHGGAARAIMVEAIVDASMQREWTANVGRRDARTRLAHLLCELGLRQEAAGVARRNHYDLPMTQEQLADATGLTAVHINRVLQALKAEGVIGRDKRAVTIADWDKLTRIGDFRATYLHPETSTIATQDAGGAAPGGAPGRQPAAGVEGRPG